MKTNFELNDIEISNAKVFMKNHKKCGIETTTGGQFEYRFFSTSIGTIIKIKCEMCKKKSDIADYSCW